MNTMSLSASSSSTKPSGLLKYSTAAGTAWMRLPFRDECRGIASRAELCSAPGEVEKSQDGFFQRHVSRPVLSRAAVVGIVLAVLSGCIPRPDCPDPAQPLP